MKIIKDLKRDLKTQWRKQPLSTAFMLGVILLAILTLFKPTSTSSIYGYLGLQAFIFIVALFLGAGLLYFAKKRNLIKI